MIQLILNFKNKHMASNNNILAVPHNFTTSQKKQASSGEVHILTEKRKDTEYFTI